jgi:hypothetical protein
METFSGSCQRQVKRRWVKPWYGTTHALATGIKE